MEQIIANLLVADNDVIQKATNDLQEAFKHPDTIPQLCDITVSSKEVTIRQYSAVLLRKRLGKLRNWQMVSPERQAIIKQGMLNALINEQEKAVRTAVAQLVGTLVKHEAEKKDPWMNEVLKFIYEHCASSDPKQSELGSSIFAILMDVAPDQFVPHMQSICDMFTAALIATEQSGNMASPVIYNILLGMTYLVPFILGHNTAEQTYQKSLPLIIKSLQAFAVLDSDKFVRAFDILENMADFTPKLLNANIKPLLDFCLEAANNPQLDSAVRVKSVAYIGWLVRLKKKVIIKQKLVEPIIQVVFNLMATEPDNEDDEEDYFLGEDSTNPMTTATQTMDLLALNVPPEKLIPPLLQLLDPALQGNNPLHKKAAYLSMAVIAEGCSEAICSKYLETMLNIVKVGITDANPIVRNAAFFALGQFSEHLQPEVTKFAPQILPILFEFLQQLCVELKSGSTEPKHIDRMFYALETFCENLEDALVPHLPLLMERLFQALDPSSSVRLRELTLSAISAACSAAKENMLPYFPQLIQMLQSFLAKTDNEDILALRPQAIDTLAALARTIGKPNFMPLANDTMKFALELMFDNEYDPDVRRALYNLIASLAEVVNEEMAAVFPKVMETIFESILSTDEVIPQYKDDAISVPPTQENEDDIDIEHSDGEDDDNIAGYSVENAYLDEKEEAILALKEFATHTGVAFLPYLEKSYENVYKMIDHPQEDIRKASIEALTSFIIALRKHENVQGVTNVVANYIPKLGTIVRDDEDCTVVMSALDAYAELLKELKELAIPTEDLRDTIFTCINDVMLGKVACQFNDPIIERGGAGDEDQEESEYDEAIIEAAGNILPLFGKAMTTDMFAMLFGRIFPVIIQKIQKSLNKEELSSQRSFGFGCLAECFAPLQGYTSQYFSTLLPLLLNGLTDEDEQVRQNCVFGLGEIVMFSENASFDSYPQILGSLSHAVAQEQHPGVLDNICGALSKMIIANSALIPLPQVLPALMQKLPLREDFSENASLFKALRSLFVQDRSVLEVYIEQIIQVVLHVLYKKEYDTDEPEVAENISTFLKEISQFYPNQFTSVVSSNPEIAQFVSTLN